MESAERTPCSAEKEKDREEMHGFGTGNGAKRAKRVNLSQIIHRHESRSEGNYHA